MSLKKTFDDAFAKTRQKIEKNGVDRFVREIGTFLREAGTLLDIDACLYFDTGEIVPPLKIKDRPTESVSDKYILEIEGVAYGLDFRITSRGGPVYTALGKYRLSNDLGSNMQWSKAELFNLSTEEGVKAFQESVVSTAALIKAYKELDGTTPPKPYRAASKEKNRATPVFKIKN